MTLLFRLTAVASTVLAAVADDSDSTSTAVAVTINVAAGVAAPDTPTAAAVVVVVVVAGPDTPTAAAVVAVPDESHVGGRGPTDLQRTLRRVELRGPRMAPQSEGHTCRGAAVALELVHSHLRPRRVVSVVVLSLVVGLVVGGAVSRHEHIVFRCCCCRVVGFGAEAPAKEVGDALWLAASIVLILYTWYYY